MLLLAALQDASSRQFLLTNPGFKFNQFNQIAADWSI